MKILIPIIVKTLGKLRIIELNIVKPEGYLQKDSPVGNIILHGEPLELSSLKSLKTQSCLHFILVKLMQDREQAYFLDLKVINMVKKGIKLCLFEDTINNIESPRNQGKIWN